MNKQPELHTTNLLMQPLSISFENAALQILRFSKIHENTHAWVIPLHTHPTIELHYILSGAGQIQIDDTLFSCGSERYLCNAAVCPTLPDFLCGGYHGGILRGMYAGASAGSEG